jgi:peptide methionine sulfoxide reductase MsrA
MQGCFWGVENYFNKHFKQGLIDSEVGYTGGEMDDPNYRMVRRLPILEKLECQYVAIVCTTTAPNVCTWSLSLWHKL